MRDYPVVQITSQLASKNVTLRADSIQEAIELAAAWAEKSDKIIESLTVGDQVVLAKSVMATGVVAPHEPPVKVTQNLSQPPPSANGSPTAPSCQHGPKEFKEGVSAKGPWKGWFCQGPKGEKCSPQWVK